MPLLGKKPFVPSKPPENLHPDAQVFFLASTGEVFVEYDAFFERTIQLNSMLWSCAATGKTGLTFEEALESERENLDSFPEFLEAPILFLVDRFCHRGRLDELVNDIYMFMKERYFIGEELNLVEGRKRHSARVIAVTHVAEKTLLNGDANIEATTTKPGNEATMAKPGSEATTTKPGNEATTAKPGSEATMAKPSNEVPLVDADHFRYTLQLLDMPENGSGSGNHDDGIREEVTRQNLSRAKATSSRAKLKLFLKSSSVLETDHLIVKQSLRQTYQLDKMNWFNVFSGPVPSFSRTPLHRRSAAGTPKNAVTGANMSSTLVVLDDVELTVSPKNVKKTTKTTKNKKQIKIAQQQEELSPLFVQAENAKVNDLSRWKQSERLLKDEDISQLRAAIKEAKEQARERNKEEKRKQREHILEWKKPRDDLCCDDLKPLPPFQALALPHWLSADDFSRMLVLHQFFVSFAEILPIRSFFSSNRRIELAEIIQAIRSPHPESPFFDLVRVLLKAKADRGDEEDGDEADVDNREEIPYEYCDLDHRQHGNRVRQVTQEHERIRMVFGLGARHLPVSRLTLSEVLRVQLTTAGYYTGLTTSRFRHFNRGGFRAWDDDGFILAGKEPNIQDRLTTMNVWQLTGSDRLALLQMLCDQLNGYFKFRQLHETRMNRLVDMKKELKNLHNWDAQQEKEAKDARLTREYERSLVESGNEKEIVRKSTSRGITALRSQLSFVREGGVLRRGGAELSQLLLDGVEYSELNLDEIVEARRLQRTYMELQVQKLQKDMFDLLEKTGLVHLGLDRAFRHYFYLESVPLILVENPSRLDAIGDCEGNGTPVTAQEDDDDDEVPLSMSKLVRNRLCLKLLACSGDRVNCPVHGNGLLRPAFLTITDPDQIEQLIEACNSRGYRESELLDNLQFSKPRLISLAEKISEMAESGELAEKLRFCAADPALDDPPLGDMQQDLLKLFLDLEEKIRIAGVGRLPLNAQERALWRSALSADGDRNDAIGTDAISVLEKEIIPAAELRQLPLITKLAIAFLRIVRSVHINFLQLPFATKENDVKDAVHGPTESFMKWQEDLLKCRSISALALFYSTFEGAIQWNKSKLMAKCRSCRKRGCNAEDMVLCSMCCACFHLSCIKTAIEDDDSEWLCMDCGGKRLTRTRPIRPSSAESSEEMEEEKESSEDIFDDEMSDDNDKNSDSSTMPMKPVLTTSSGRIVKKVKYDDDDDETTTFPPISTRQHRYSTRGPLRRRPAAMQNGHSSENGYESTSTSEDSDQPAKRARVNGRSNNGISTRSLSMGLREGSSQRDNLRQCERIVSDAIRQEFASAFCDPVNRKEVPDYYGVIKRPMDLRSMLNKLKNRVYNTVREVIDDVKLIVANCHTYNEDESEINEDVDRLERFLMDRICALE